mgnify:FL=1
MSKKDQYFVIYQQLVESMTQVAGYLVVCETSWRSQPITCTATAMLHTTVGAFNTVNIKTKETLQERKFQKLRFAWSFEMWHCFPKWINNIYI